METIKNNKNIVVSLAIGDKFYKIYNKYFEDSYRKYAAKIGADFIVIKDWIEKSDKHPSWQKLLIFKLKKITTYNKILFLDADIYVNNLAENIFDVVSEESSAAVKNNSQNISRIQDGDNTVIEQQCPTKNRPDYLINGGMLVLNPKNKTLLEEVYYSYTDQTCYEQGPLSYHLINDKNFIMLDSKFNTIIPDYLEVNKYKLSTIIKMYSENYFLHTAGGLNKIIINTATLFDKYPIFLKLAQKISQIKILDYIIGLSIKIIRSLWWRFDKIFKI